MKKSLAGLYHSIFYKNGNLRPLSIFRNKNKRPVTLPHDDAFLSDQEVQWWYWTGHLQSETGRKFGFEVVFFAFDSWIFFKNQLAQAAITDAEKNEYHYREDVAFLSLPKKLDGKFNLMANLLDKNIISATGGNGSDVIYFEVEDYIVNLSLKSTQDPVIHYDGKAHHYDFGGYTYYYSREKMQTEGTIKIGNEEFKVTGTSWFDRQYGDLYFAIFKGWQWFAIELYDGISIMIYDFLGKNKAEKFGSITKNNKSKEFGPDDFEVKVLGKWKSPNTGIKYPSGWEVTADGTTMIIEPVVKNQELKAQHTFWIGPEYWEGDCYIKDKNGNIIGDAYVELNGFGKKLISVEVGGHTDFGI